MLNNVVALLGGGAAPDLGAYEAIQTYTVGAGGTSSITFNLSGVTGYKHLQIRSSLLTASGGQVIKINFNSDGSAIYTEHALVGNGSSPSADASTSLSGGVIFGRVVGTSTTSPTGIVTDILDYADTNKYKTIRSLGGMDANGSGEINLISSLWQSTSAISNISISTFSGVNLAQYSSFALYGIKG